MDKYQKEALSKIQEAKKALYEAEVNLEYIGGVKEDAAHAVDDRAAEKESLEEDFKNGNAT